MHIYLKILTYPNFTKTSRIMLCSVMRHRGGIGRCGQKPEGLSFNHCECTIDKK